MSHYKLITQDTVLAETKKSKYKINVIDSIAQIKLAEGVDITKHIKVNETSDKKTVAEFIGSDNFASQFYERQHYEVDAGRDEVAQLFNWLFNPIVDGNLPRVIKVNSVGPAGVILTRITEGGEVEFATVGQGSRSLELLKYAVGLAYTEDLFEYNELWRLPNFERAFGRAHTALINHLRFSQVISYGYTAANQTDGSALGSFAKTDGLPIKYLRTLEAAIEASTTDTTNPRRGPYGVVCSTSDLFIIERALNRVPQQGYDLQSSAIGRIRVLAAYDGWTGMRGKKTVEYPGVTAGKSYLVSLANRDEDFQQFTKTPFRRRQDGDLKRFIMEEVIWDTRTGVFVNPVRAVEEITWPAGTDGTT